MNLGTAASDTSARTLTLVKSSPLDDVVAFENSLESPRQDANFVEILARSLEIGDLLETFFRHDLLMALKYDGYLYRHTELGVDYAWGEQRRHRCEYRLVLEGNELGQLSLFRKRKFSLVEVETFETVLCALIYPLRNAVLYQEALNSAYRDPLTGVDNRAALENRLPREVQLAQRYATPTALMVLDVDHFKSINDNFGHRTGDLLLQSFVGVLAKVLRTTDWVYRYGGDEFVVLLRSTDLQGAICVAERVRLQTEQEAIAIAGKKLVLTTSIGLTLLTPEDTLESVFARADQALLLAKRRGRNQIISVEPSSVDKPEGVA